MSMSPTTESAVDYTALARRVLDVVLVRVQPLGVFATTDRDQRLSWRTPNGWLRLVADSSSRTGCINFGLYLDEGGLCQAIPVALWFFQGDGQVSPHVVRIKVGRRGHPEESDQAEFGLPDDRVFASWLNGRPPRPNVTDDMVEAIAAYPRQPV